MKKSHSRHLSTIALILAMGLPSFVSAGTVDGDVKVASKAGHGVFDDLLVKILENQPIRTHIDEKGEDGEKVGHGFFDDLLVRLLENQPVRSHVDEAGE